MAIPKIIHFKIPNPATDLQQSVIETTKRLHPDWQIMIWQDPVASEGFRLAKYWEHAKSGAQVADMIRLETVLKYGGVYLDSDVVMHRPLDELVAAYDFFTCSEDGNVLSTGAFGATAGHPALIKVIDELDNHPPDWSLPPNITTGPCLFSRMLKWDKDMTALPRETFYPYNWNEKVSPPHPFSYGTHVWAASWIKKGSWKRTWINLISRLGLYRHFAALSSMEGLSREYTRWALSKEWVIKRLPRNATTYPTSEKLVSKTIHGHSIILSGKDLSVTPEVAQQGYYELREELFLKRVLHGGDYFVDVGANVGTFSLLAASIVGPFGRVHAYEPHPLAADMLRDSAIMNGVHAQLIVSRVAVGARMGHAVLKSDPSMLACATLADDSQASPHTQAYGHLAHADAIDTPVVTLDSEFPCDISIKFLKIDVEGCEASVLQGAERLLSRQCVDYVMIEAIEEAADKSFLVLLEALQKVCGYGYSPYYLGRNGHPIPIELAAVLKGGKKVPARNVVLMSKFAAARHS
jgi:FkbM family methyltransferase